MILSPFTLVRSRSKEKRYAAPSSVAKALETQLPLKGTLAASGRNIISRPVKERKAVGVWDLGAWVGALPQIVQSLNNAQDIVLFFEAQAAIPSGLTSGKARVGQWSEATLGRKLKRKEREELSEAIIDVEFFDFAKPVRKDLGVDFLIGLSPDPIAGETDDDDGHVTHSDFFCSSDGKISIVSTVGVRELADKANRTFEFAIGFIITSVMFAALNGMRVGFHEDNNCLMDYNYNRATIADRFAQPEICNNCARESKPEILKMAMNMLRALEKFPRPVGKTRKS